MKLLGGILLFLISFSLAYASEVREEITFHSKTTMIRCSQFCYHQGTEDKSTLIVAVEQEDGSIAGGGYLNTITFTSNEVSRVYRVSLDLHKAFGESRFTGEIRFWRQIAPGNFASWESFGARITFKQNKDGSYPYLAFNGKTSEPISTGFIQLDTVLFEN